MIMTKKKNSHDSIVLRDVLRKASIVEIFVMITIGIICLKWNYNLSCIMKMFYYLKDLKCLFDN